MLSLVQARDLDPEVLARFLATPDPPAGFRRSESAAYYQWLVTASDGVETVALAAVDGDRVVGVLCAVLRRVIAGRRDAAHGQARGDANRSAGAWTGRDESRLLGRA